MLIRTVLDIRSRENRKHIYHFLLLAGSWYVNVKNKGMFPLEVITVGSAPARLTQFFQELGIRWLESEPHSNDWFSKYSNKLLGSTIPASDRVLLLDNDVFLLRDPLALLDSDAETLYASIAGFASVRPDQWLLVKEELGVTPRQLEWTPLVSEYKAVLQGITLPTCSQLFCNSGSILLPNDPDVGVQWGNHILAIANLFASHPLRNDVVYGHDQAGFAITCGTYRKFELLPLKHNYRPPCFWLGKETFESISIIHLTTLHAGRQHFPLDFETSIRHYWETHVNGRIKNLEARISPTELNTRINTSQLCLDNIVSVIRERGLDDAARACIS